MDRLGLHAIVKGLVQGVGYRWFALRAASSLKLTGWAKNLPDTTVEIEAFGSRGALDAYIKELSRGPSFSKVNDVMVSWIEYNSNYTDFIVK